MDLRIGLDGMTPEERIAERRRRIEEECHAPLSLLSLTPEQIGSADEKNCEQMIGAVPIPVGIVGPLLIHSAGMQPALDMQAFEVYLPLATTEAALVASVNRGCKAVTMSGGVKTRSTYHGVTRSLAFKLKAQDSRLKASLQEREAQWKSIGEATSKHLKILSYDIDEAEGYLFLTITADTDEAMGMNMVTIAAQAIGEWIEEHIDLAFVTVAANIDSDKKPSKRTKERGRGYEVHAESIISPEVIATVLKTTPETLIAAADAKLRVGSDLAGALGKNLHAANVIAALYLATGQDAAHVVEGSLTDTSVSEMPMTKDPVGEGYPSPTGSGILIRTRLPALMVGVCGGGTELPAQSQCLRLLIGPETSNEQPFDYAQDRRATSKLHPSRLLAEIIGGAVLAGELSLLAAQASHTLAKAHRKLARGSGKR